MASSPRLKNSARAGSLKGSSPLLTYWEKRKFSTMYWPTIKSKVSWVMGSTKMCATGCSRWTLPRNHKYCYFTVTSCFQSISWWSITSSGRKWLWIPLLSVSKGEGRSFPSWRISLWLRSHSSGLWKRSTSLWTKISLSFYLFLLTSRQNAHTSDTSRIKLLRPCFYLIFCTNWQKM